MPFPVARTRAFLLSSAAFLAVAIAACGGGQKAQGPSQTVVVAPPSGSAHATTTTVADADDAGTPAPYSVNAKTMYLATKELAAAGRTAEARAAFLEGERKFPYSRYARDSELQVVRIELDAMDRPGGVRRLRKFIREHASDPRLAALHETLLVLECEDGVAASCNEVHTLAGGFGACTRDQDCSVHAEPPCCSCCPGFPKAMSDAWFAKAKAECGASECAECILSCVKVEPASAYRAACVKNACVIQPK
jgi:hypothetical protein